MDLLIDLQQCFYHRIIRIIISLFSLIFLLYFIVVLFDFISVYLNLLYAFMLLYK